MKKIIMDKVKSVLPVACICILACFSVNSCKDYYQGNYSTETSSTAVVKTEGTTNKDSSTYIDYVEGFKTLAEDYSNCYGQLLALNQDYNSGKINKSAWIEGNNKLTKKINDNNTAYNKLNKKYSKKLNK